MPLNTSYNSYHSKNGNILWGGAMVLAWKEIIDSFTQEPLKFETKNDIQIRMIENFNSHKFSKENLDEGSCYVKSGYGQNTVDLINKETKAKFPTKTIPPL